MQIIDCPWSMGWLMVLCSKKEAIGFIKYCLLLAVPIKETTTLPDRYILTQELIISPNWEDTFGHCDPSWEHLPKIWIYKESSFKSVFLEYYEVMK